MVVNPFRPIRAPVAHPCLPGGPHGPVGLKFLALQLKMAVWVAAVIAVAMPALAYFNLYSDYTR